MVTVGEELDKAVQGAFTRPIPKSAGAQMRYLVKQHGRRTMPVAELLGISQRTVERYVNNQIKKPRPELADRLQKVGEYLRFNTSLDRRLNEMAIIMSAQYWGAQYEWYAHAPLALKAGLDPAIVKAIGEGRKPDSMKDDEAIVWDFTTQLRRDRAVDDATYARAVGTFGEQGVMDLVAVNGYYDLVSMTLNVARVKAPADAELPFKQAGN